MTEKLRTDHDHDLVFYSLSTCVMCRKALDYLREHGFPYRLVYVDQLPIEEKQALKERLSAQYSMRVVFPALSIDDTRLVLGFFRSAWDEALGVDPAGEGSGG
jgi:glutaredoxin-like protein NrdH